MFSSVSVEGKFCNVFFVTIFAFVSLSNPNFRNIFCTGSVTMIGHICFIESEKEEFIFNSTFNGRPKHSMHDVCIHISVEVSSARNSLMSFISSSDMIRAFSVTAS